MRETLVAGVVIGGIAGLLFLLERLLPLRRPRRPLARRLLVNLTFAAIAFAAAGLAGCQVGDYVPPRPVNEPGPAHQREFLEGRPGLLGDLRWTSDLSGKRGEPSASLTDAEEFKRWKEANPSSEERREFEEWRAWQEWKRKNPK